MSKVFLIESRRAAYLHEILKTGGVCNTQLLPLERALDKAGQGKDIVVLSGDSLSESQALRLSEFVRNGGVAIAACPCETLHRLAGLGGSAENEREGGSGVPPEFRRLRWISPVCYGARSEPLLTLGPIWRFRPEREGEAMGYLYSSRDLGSESIGVWKTTLGQGTLMVYAYDVALCIARLRQGFPGKATQAPEGACAEAAPTPRAIHLHESAADCGTFWKPTADLHASAFAEVVCHRMDHPVPRLWHLPHAAPSLVIYTGDEDGAPQEANHRQMSDVAAAGGTMSLYVMPDFTSLTPRLAEEYKNAGHAISVHPDLTGKHPAPLSEQIECAREQVRRFQDLLGLSVHTVRNHCYMWPGYLELPTLWEELGIGLDLNTTGTLYGLSLDSGPYANAHSAMPMRFVREDGSLIQVFQQCTHLNDDLTANAAGTFSAKYVGETSAALVERIMSDAAAYFHTPVCINIHPENYVAFSASLSGQILRRAAEADLPVWSADRWYHFWRLRDQWTLSHCEWSGQTLSLRYEGPACGGLSVLLPSRHQGSCLKELTLDGEKVPAKPFLRNGKDAIAVEFPKDCQLVNIAASYEAGREKGRGANRGVSLIELLVTVAILAVLASLLLPAINGFQQRARTVQCAQNLRSYGVAALAYSAERDGRIVQPENYSSGHWYYALAPYISRDVYGPEPFLRCPTLTKKHGNPPSWFHATGYLMNLFFSSSSGVPGAQGSENYQSPVRLVNLRDPSRTPLLWDNDNYESSSTEGGYAYSGGGPWYYKMYEAHGNGFHMMFFDGHLEHVPFNKSGPFKGEGAGDYPKYDWAPHGAGAYGAPPTEN